MVDRAVEPIIMGEATVKFGADNYEAHVSSAAFVPGENAPVIWKGLTATAKFSFGRRATWTFQIEAAQDWETAEALSQFLLENEGEEVPVILEPVAGGNGYTATVIVTPIQIGGKVDEVATGTATMGVKGVPTLVV